MAYVLGVSSGIFGAASQEEKMQYAGLYKKAQYSITKGVNFVQIDLETISEFHDPDLVENMKKINRLGIEFGIHSETPAFGGRELPHLDSAIELDYRRGHERMIFILKGAGDIKSKYVLIHSSESMPFLVLGRELQPTELVDIWGRPIEQFIKEIGGNDDITKNWIMQWVWEQDYIWLDILHDTPKGAIKRLEDTRRFELTQHTRRDVRRQKAHEQGIREEDYKLTAEDEKVVEKVEEVVWKDEVEAFEEKEKKELLEYFLRLVKSKSLSYGPERTAYYIIAKWMEKNNDPLWKPIIDVTIDYYAKREGKTREEWLESRNIKKCEVDDKKFRDDYRLWVPCVSAKYIWGHFMQDRCPSGEQYEDPKQILKDEKVLFVLETPMAGAGYEDQLRFPQPAQMYYLVKEVGEEYMGLAVDLEHLLMIGVDPNKAVEVLPDDAGKYIKVIHTGWPSPIGPSHIPIPLGSEQQMYLYKMYYELRKKGMGKDKNEKVYIIFERGGGQDPIQQSVITMRLIRDFLEKDIKPGELVNHPEFFGINVGQIASMERQREIIREHGRDPLKGLITTPEETYTFLGKAAIEKGKRPEEWKKEEKR